MRVNNAPQLDIMPLVGDFNFYGGIYRDVDLYVTDKECISLLDHGSEGVCLYQEKVSKENALVKAVVRTSGDTNGKVVLRVVDHLGNTIVKTEGKVANKETGEIELPF